MPNECNDLTPSLCGGSRLPTAKDIDCRSIYFTGVDDVSVNQGENCIDLTAGVHAYNGGGVEIPFTVDPETIDCCAVGAHTVTYKATGIGEKLMPTMCLGKQPLHITDCGMSTATKRRTITVQPYGVVCESKVCCASAMC